MQYLMVILCSYIVGSSSMSYYISRINKIDMKKDGSKNLGASNTVLLIGWKAGILVAIHDVLKAFLAVVVTKMLFPELPYAAELAGVASVLGHIFPFYLKFDGGKGFASYIGMTLALNFKFGLMLVVALVIIALITNYIVSATMTSVIVVPIYHGFVSHNYVIALILCIASVIIIYKHRENLVKIMNGTETKIMNVVKR